MGTHDGHRQRMKDRFLRSGLSDFSEHEVLELLLYYCIPRRDTNEIAHNLCSHFGSLSKVLDASVYELQRVEGMGENAAIFLSLLKEVNQYYHINRFELTKPLDSYDAVGAYLRSHFLTAKNESVYLLCLDAKRMAISCDKITEGSLNSAVISPRRVVQMALDRNATFVILGHNHPGGIAIPSDEDRQTTIKLAKTLWSVGIALIDHVVVADNDHISLAQSCIYSFDDVCNEMNEDF